MILFLCLIIYYVQNFDPVVDDHDDRPSQPSTFIAYVLKVTRRGEAINPLPAS
jgi:hypothetical protein